MKTLTTIRACAIAAAALLAAGTASASCFSVYNKSTNQLVYQSTESPIDLTQPVSQSMNRRFPGGHMIFSTAGNELCPAVNNVVDPNAATATATKAKGKKKRYARRNWDRPPGYEK